MKHTERKTQDVQPRRIAVFRALFLGDMLCALPALRALHQRFPQAEITLIGLPWVAELVKRLPYIDRLLIFPGYPGIVEVEYDPIRTNTFLADVRALPYHLAVQMHGDGSVSNGFVADLGAHLSLGYRRPNDDRLTLGLDYDPNEHEVLRWLRLVGCLGADQHDPHTEFPILPGEETRARQLLAQIPASSGPLVGMHVGAKDAIRCWPARCFAQLADLLVEQYDARIVLTGGESERALTDMVRRMMHYSALDLAGRTDLGTFGALIKNLDLLVTNDTGASHMAAATATRSVVLFGPTRPAQWAPLDQTLHVVVDALALAKPGGDPAQALQQLALEPVLAACMQLLDAIHARQIAYGMGGV